MIEAGRVLQHAAHDNDLLKETFRIFDVGYCGLLRLLEVLATLDFTAALVRRTNYSEAETIPLPRGHHNSSSQRKVSHAPDRGQKEISRQDASNIP